jgi:chemotaxis protein methyltransferase CheR
MRDAECVELLQWALPQLELRWSGFRKVRRQVCRRVDRRRAELGLETAREYRAYLEAHPAEWSRLDSLCRISISRFYRDREVFELLGREVLPALARDAVRESRERLRCWSAGCASGEEPFSLKLVWQLRVRESFPGIDLHILATDADPGLLERARRACYPASALKDLPRGWLERAFARCDTDYRLRTEFREGIEFDCQDIRSRMPEGPFDLVLCRNLVLTYFEEALQRRILARISRRLSPGALLVVGRRESLPEGIAGLARWGDHPCLYRRDADPRGALGSGF